jgi:CubicO group peptidase (beta-lactamase class C family)
MLKEMQGFDEFANQVLKDWKVPACALAVVKNGEVVHSQGYGLRDVEQNLPTTSDTLFAIGSSSKAFSATAIGILVDDGKLEWDKPIRDYIPEFKMFDPIATDKLTVRDMLCHRSGLPRHDLVWIYSKATRRELMQALAYLEPNEGFRNKWQYQNIIYLSTGILIEAVTGKTWEEFVRERIWEPLGMTGSTFSVDESQKRSDFAVPYAEKDDVVKRIPFHQIDAVGPAGSINSNLTDMARWLIFNLNKGKVGDTQIISEASLHTLQSPQMAITDQSLAALYDAETDSYLDYGMGWIMWHYRGIPIVEHSGGIDGFATEVVLVPSQMLGIVTFTNVGSIMPMTMYRSALDRMLGLEPLDWAGKFKTKMDNMKKMAKEAKEKSVSDRKLDTHPSHPLADYAGTYQHPAYGKMEISLEGDKLAAKFHDNPIALSHFHYDIFEGEHLRLDMKFMFNFEIDEKGNIERVSVPLEQSVKPIVFKRLASEEMTLRSFMEPFVGEYEAMGQVLQVTIKGENTLVASGLGMTDMELVPYHGTEYSLKAASSISLTFQNVENGKAMEVVIKQPGISLPAKRK